MPAIQALLGSGGTNSFTINPSDFSGFGYGPGVSPDGTNGFVTESPAYGVGKQEYIIQSGGSFNTRLWDSIYSIYIRNGLPIDNTAGYVFNVKWGPGSSITNGKAMIGAYFNGPGSYNNIQLSPIDTSDSTWQTGGQNINLNPLALLGTFIFPATFTLYKPIISNPSNWWC